MTLNNQEDLPEFLANHVFLCILVSLSSSSVKTPFLVYDCLVGSIIKLCEALVKRNI